MRNLLVVAFHFPPQSGSSGFLRALKFSRYLSNYGWRAFVLTANERAYERLDYKQLAAVPADLRVIRAFCLDAKRHLSVRGAHFRFVALPDRWVTWCLGAVPAGLYAIRSHRIDAIFSTYPIATAVMIGLFLHRLTKKPWIIDFRDSMTEDDYPRDYRTRCIYRWIERQAIRYGSRFVFTADSARRMYLERYPGLRPDSCLVIHNGYDEEDFAGLCAAEPSSQPSRPLRLLHSGLIYPHERDPGHFFRAVARLKRERRVDSSRVQIDLRASGSENEYSAQLKDLDIDDIVNLLPPLPYQEALEESTRADALILMQAANCNHQIPAKVYEYLRLGKPILALTAAEGDTARLLRSVGGATIVDLADEAGQCSALPEFLEAILSKRHSLPDPQAVRQYTRESQTRALAMCLNKAVGERV